MRALFLSFGIFFGFCGAVYASDERVGEPAWTSVEVVQDQSKLETTAKLSLRIRAFSPPIILDEGKWPKDRGAEPPWYKAYYINSHYNEFSYEEFQSICAPEFLEQNLISKKKFDTYASRYSKSREISPATSIVWEVDLKLDEKTYVVVVSDRYEKLPSLPEDNEKLKPFSLTPYQLVGNTWKQQTMKALGIAHFLPYPDRPALLKIVRTGKASLRGGIILAK